MTGNVARRLLPWIVALLACCGCEVPTHQTSFSGRVVGVSDGDTITVLVGLREVKVRLYGIDCPEIKQAFGTQARTFTSGLVFGRNVTVLSQGTDAYGRTLADVLLPDGRNLNEAIVAGGMGWWYERYAPDEIGLGALQQAARVQRLGLWQDRNPVPPWEFRRRQRGSRTPGPGSKASVLDSTVTSQHQ